MVEQGQKPLLKNQLKTEGNSYVQEIKKFRAEIDELSDLYKHYNVDGSLDFVPEKIEGLEQKIQELERINWERKTLKKKVFQAKAQKENLETLAHFAPLTDLPASNLLYRQSGFVHRESYKRTHKRALQIRSKLDHWPYLCAQYTGWHAYGFTGGKEGGAQYRDAWKFYHYITGRTGAVFQPKKFNRSNVRSVLESDSSPKLLGLYFSATGTGNKVAKAKKKYNKIKRILEKYRSGEIKLSPGRLSQLEEAEKTDKVTDNSHMTLVLPKRSFTKQMLMESGFRTVGAFLNNYYGLDQHTKRKGRSLIQSFSVSVNGKTMKFGQAKRIKISAVTGEISMNNSVLLEYFGSAEVRVRSLKKTLGEWDRGRGMPRFTPKFIAELKPKYRNLYNHPTIVGIKKNLFKGQFEAKKDIQSIIDWPSWYPQKKFGDNTHADSVLMFNRALKIERNPPKPPKKLKKGASLTEKENYGQKRRKYYLQRKYYKLHRKRIQRKNLRPKYKAFIKKFEKLRIQHINKSFASTGLYNPQYEKLSQIYHRYLKVTMKQIQPGQKMLVVPKDAKKEDIDFLYEKLKVELSQQGYQKISLIPENRESKEKKYTLNDFFRRNFLNKTRLNNKENESRTFSDISKEEFDIFMNESPHYPLDAVMRIIAEDSNPDGYLVRIVNKYKNKKILPKYFLEHESDIFLKPKTIKKIEKTIQEHYEKYKAWKNGIREKANIVYPEVFYDTFNNYNFKKFNESFLDEIIPNPYMQMSERLIMYNEIGQSGEGNSFSREKFSKFLDKNNIKDEETVGYFQVRDTFVRDNISAFIEKAEKTFDLAVHNIEDKSHLSHHFEHQLKSLNQVKKILSKRTVKNFDETQDKILKFIDSELEKLNLNNDVEFSKNSEIQKEELEQIKEYLLKEQDLDQKLRTLKTDLKVSKDKKNNFIANFFRSSDVKLQNQKDFEVKKQQKIEIENSLKEVQEKLRKYTKKVVKKNKHLKWEFNFVKNFKEDLTEIKDIQSEFKDEITEFIRLRKIPKSMRTESNTSKIESLNSILKDPTERIEQLLRKNPHFSRLANILLMKENYADVKKLSVKLGVDYDKYSNYLIRTLANAHQIGVRGVREEEDYNRWILSAEKLGLLKDGGGAYQEKIIEEHEAEVRERTAKKIIDKIIEKGPSFLKKNTQGLIDIDIPKEGFRHQQLLKYMKSYRSRVDKVLKGAEQTWDEKLGLWLLRQGASFKGINFKDKKLLRAVHNMFFSKEYKMERTHKLFSVTSGKVLQKILSVWNNPQNPLESKLISDLKKEGFDTQKLGKIKEKLEAHFKVYGLKKKLKPLEKKRKGLVMIINEWKEKRAYLENITSPAEYKKEMSLKEQLLNSYNREIKSLTQKIKILSIHGSPKNFLDTQKRTRINPKTKKKEDYFEYKNKDYALLIKTIQQSLGINLGDIKNSEYLKINSNESLLRGRYGAKAFVKLGK